MVSTLLALLLVPAAPGGAQSPQADRGPCEYTTAERVVAVGDVHGAYDRFVGILREAEILDTADRWIGGRAILIQTGDVVDRGPDSRKVLDLLRRLEREAADAGGRVHALLGNHETMWMLGDLRYVSPGEYASFRSPEAAALRDRLYQVRLAARQQQAQASGEALDETAFRQDFEQRTPLGLVELVLSMAAEGEYGRWLRSHDTMIQINDVVFMHGGASPEVAALSCTDVNDRVRAELQATDAVSDPAQTLVASATGPLWYRGLVDGGEAATTAQAAAALQALGARALVVGHTVPDTHEIRLSFDGRVVQIDTGMLGGQFYPGGVASALEVVDGRFTAIYAGRRVALGPVPGGPVTDR